MTRTPCCVEPPKPSGVSCSAIRGASHKHSQFKRKRFVSWSSTSPPPAPLAAPPHSPAAGRKGGRAALSAEGSPPAGPGPLRECGPKDGPLGITVHCAPARPLGRALRGAASRPHPSGRAGSWHRRFHLHFEMKSDIFLKEGRADLATLTLRAHSADQLCCCSAPKSEKLSVQLQDFDKNRIVGCETHH